MQRVAIQGEAASYHHQAAHTFFGEDIELVFCDTFAKVFLAVAHGGVDRGVVALENTLYGPINNVYDLFLKHHAHIVGEVYLRIEHCLLGIPGATLADIREVHSQIMALAQCEEYLDTTLPYAKRLEHHDTAASAADVKKWHDPHKAAIASEQAGVLYGLDVLAKGIETNKANFTRFAIISDQPSVSPSANKTSLVIKTPADTKPGALHRALGVFAKHGINISMLHSRPIIGKAWHYMFYVDVDASCASDSFATCAAKLSTQGCDVVVLGSYEAGI